MRLRKLAKSNVGPASSLMKTWSRMHHRWFGEEVPVLPITREKLEAVASQMCSMRYRSFKNYLAAAKRAHVLEPNNRNGDWPEALKAVGRECTRAVLRGIGPAKQCSVFEGGLASVLALELAPAPLVHDGPVGPENLVVLGAFFLLREIEASLMLAKSVKTNTDTKTVWVHLAASKTDPHALSVWRFWGCVCGEGDRKPRAPCPFHAATKQEAILRHLADTRKVNLSDLTFFPTATGKVVTKDRVVRTFEGIADKLGEPLRDAQRNRRFTGHLLRVLGARELAAAGIELFKIQLLARWKSPIIMRYAAEAPLQALTADYVRRHQKRELDDLVILAKETGQSKSNRAEFDQINQTLFELILRESELRSLLVGGEDGAFDGNFVRNTRSACWHQQAPGTRSTRCGWAFETLPHELSSTLPSAAWHELCDSCLPKIQRARYHSRTRRLDSEPESAPE